MKFKVNPKQTRLSRAKHRCSLLLSLVFSLDSQWSKIFEYAEQKSRYFESEGYVILKHFYERSLYCKLTLGSLFSPSLEFPPHNLQPSHFAPPEPTHSGVQQPPRLPGPRGQTSGAYKGVWKLSYSNFLMLAGVDWLEKHLKGEHFLKGKNGKSYF